MLKYMLSIIAFLLARTYLMLFLIKRRISPGLQIQEGMHPFHLKGHGSNKKTGVLLLHASCSAPAELRELADSLNNRGYTVYAPLLPGHGTVPEMLAFTKYHEWLKAGEEAVMLLEEECDAIIIGGTSLGASLSLCLSNTSPKVHGIVTLGATALFPRKMRAISPLAPLLFRMKVMIKRRFTKTFKSRVGPSKELSYLQIPLLGALQLEKVVKYAVRQLPTITKPILICQAMPEETLDARSAQRIFDRVSSKKKEIYYAYGSVHSILIDPEHKRALIEKVTSFVDEVASKKKAVLTN